MKWSSSFVLILTFPLFLLAQDRTVGVFENDSLSFNGYTLFNANSSNETYLIDNCGHVVNQWSSEFRPGLSVFLMEDGSLLRTARITSVFQGGGTGGRIELFNWEGDLQWFYDYSSPNVHQHHDITPLPNGNVLILAWELFSREEAIDAGRDPALVSNQGLWSEHIVELKPVGADPAEIVWEWHLWDHLIQDYDSTKINFGIVAEHPELMNLNFAPDEEDRDWLHANAIDYHPGLDQIILSSRVFNEFYIIDHSTTSEESASHEGGDSGKGGDFLYRWGNPQSYDRGTMQEQKLFGQHRVHWIPEGHPGAGKILLFNNGLNRPDGNYSTVDIVDPPLNNDGSYTLVPNEPFGPLDFDWTLEEGPSGSFYSSRISGAQRLSNGNTLVCNGNEGQFFEVTPDGTIVWNYINPVRNNGPVSQGDNIDGNDVFRTHRYAPDYSAFENRTLTPGALIELDPIADDCVIYEEEPVSIYTIKKRKDLEIYPNPIEDHLQIINKTGNPLVLRINDVNGTLLFEKNIQKQAQTFLLNQLVSGLYIATIFSETGQFLEARKVVKN